MKKLIVTVFAICAIAHVSQAQPPKMVKTPAMEKAITGKGIKESRDKKYADAFKAANLNADEQTKARAILDQSYRSMKAVKANASLSAAEKTVKLKALSREKNSQLKSALSTKYKAFKQAMKVENHEARGY